jgi:hypothetical protein
VISLLGFDYPDPHQDVMNIDLAQIDSSEPREMPIIRKETQNSTVAEVVAIDVPPFCDAVTINPKSLDIITTVKIWDAHVFENIALNGPPRLTVFRSWPHSPSSIPDPSKLGYRGKVTPNGLPWGATIFDFYTVRQPEDPRGISKAKNVFSGSQLLEWSKANGENIFAKDEIEWARREEEPFVLEPPAHGLFVVEQEANIRARKEGWGMSMPRDTVLNSIDPTDNVCFLFLYSRRLR